MTDMVALGRISANITPQKYRTHISLIRHRCCITSVIDGVLKYTLLSLAQLCLFMVNFMALSSDVHHRALSGSVTGDWWVLVRLGSGLIFCSDAHRTLLSKTLVALNMRAMYVSSEDRNKYSIWYCVNTQTAIERSYCQNTKYYRGYTDRLSVINIRKRTISLFSYV